MKVCFTETVLRDGNQSLMATRLRAQDFEPILDEMDKAGYYSVECWGGATFDSCLRYLDEDPWERLRMLRSHFKNTKLQMLLRGQNMLGYHNYPDDVVRSFIARAVANGIDIIRIFDALNDPKNLETAIKETKKRGAEAQGTISYTISPVHTLEMYVALGKKLKDMGSDSICIKDMAGIMAPQQAFELVSALKSEVGLPVILHTHCTSGLAPLTLLKAVEAGVDRVDTAIASFSGGSSQFATQSLAFALEGLGYETGLDNECLSRIDAFFRPLKERAVAEGLTSPYILGTDADILVYQVPGGMLSNLQANLKNMNALDRFEEVLREVPRVREDLGYPPLVTPTSQMVGAQAVTNVVTGERYKVISREVKAYLRGEYGAMPGPVDKELQEKVLKGTEPLQCRPADLLRPGIPKAMQELGSLARCGEDVLSYALFPDQARTFLERRAAERGIG